MHRLCSLAVAFILAVGLMAPTPAEAQTNVELGPRLVIPAGDVADLGGNLGIGADARISSASLPVVLNPSFDLYFTDDFNGVDQSFYAIDLNALYEFGVDNEVFTPYAGGGLAITNWSVDINDGPGITDPSTTEVGLNIVGGARFLLGRVAPFAQLNATVGGDLERLGITGGILFQL